MNWVMYGPQDIPNQLGFRLSPLKLKDEPYASKWTTMSRFERICWTWKTINTHALNTFGANPDARMFKFEGIFQPPDKNEALKRLLDFCVGFPDGEIAYHDSFDGILCQKENRSVGNFPDWRHWSTEHMDTFKEICGPLMQRSGYTSWSLICTVNQEDGFFRFGEKFNAKGWRHSRICWPSSISLEQASLDTSGFWESPAYLEKWAGVRKPLILIPPSSKFPAPSSRLSILSDFNNFPFILGPFNHTSFSVSERRLSSEAYRNQVSNDLLGLDTSLRDYSTGTTTV